MHVEAINSEQEIINGLKTILLLNGLKPVDVAEHNYWFLRTQGGEYFDEFCLNDYVAIGWDDVPCKSEKERTEVLKEQLKATYGQPTRVLNQVYRFCEEMKAGDIVMIPSSGTSHLAFGRLLDDEIYSHVSSEEELEAGKCPYVRRRKVEWLKAGKRNMVDPKLFSFFRNQQALAKANEYAEFIERAVNPFYIKDGIAHLNLSVNIKESPKATDIPYFILGLQEQMNLMSTSLGLEVEEPDVRINVQSAGIIELLGPTSCIFLIAVAVVGIFGGKVGLLGFNFETEGVVKRIVDAYKTYQEAKHLVSNEKLTEISNRLNIDNPMEK